MRLRDFKGKTGQIGKLNAKTIPHPEKSIEYESTLESLASYLNMANIIRNGIYRNGKHRSYNSLGLNDMKKNHIPVFDKQGKLVINIPKFTFTNLLKSYKKTKSIIKMTTKEINDLNEDLHEMATKQRSTTNTAKWKMEPKINNIIIQAFNIEAELFTDPFSREARIRIFYSTNEKDETFGARNQNKKATWKETGLINTIPATQKEKIILQSIQSAESHQTKTVVIIPEKDIKKIKLDPRKKEYIHEVMTWRNGLHLISSINREKKKILDDPIGMYLITKEQHPSISEEFQTKITRISEEIYGYTPDFALKTNASEMRRPPRRNQQSDTCTPKIGTHMITTTLTALHIKHVNYTIKTINKILDRTGKETDKNDNRDTKRERITHNDVITVRKKLARFIISELDKNTGQLYVS